MLDPRVRSIQGPPSVDVSRRSYRKPDKRNSCVEEKPLFSTQVKRPSDQTNNNVMKSIWNRIDQDFHYILNEKPHKDKHDKVIYVLTARNHRQRHGKCVKVIQSSEFHIRFASIQESQKTKSRLKFGSALHDHLQSKVRASVCE